MKTVCDINQCAGCMACVDICPRNAIIIHDNINAYNAYIQEEKCVDCNACVKVCQKIYPSEAREPSSWFQGWSRNKVIRDAGSSGGVATEIATSFIKNGGLVCGCALVDGMFRFIITDKKEEVLRFQGSKYVKSNPRGIYKIADIELKKGKKVLFIGLPCQVSAIRKYIGKEYEHLLYTVDLICHGTPAPRLLHEFLKQYDTNLRETNNLSFRHKNKYGLTDDSRKYTFKSVLDRYMIAFLNSFSYTENCYHCEYSKKSRVGDITLGDSWGSELPVCEMQKGISLILCQNQKGMELLNLSDLHLKDVDLDRAIQYNGQLSKPAIKPKHRDKFIDGIKEGKSFNSMLLKCCPRACIRQDIKELLIRLKIWRD